VSATEWLARVSHDLVKRVLWPARDRRDLGGAVVPGELIASVVDEDGAPIGPAALWRTLAAESPAGVTPAALDAFARALDGALAAAARDDLAGVLALEPAFAELARNVRGADGGNN
jgi:hypothetical protein